MRSKTIICAITLLLFPAYLLYLAVLPTEIIGVHQYGNSSRIVVKNFPLTNHGKIKWWVRNKEELKKITEYLFHIKKMEILRCHFGTLAMATTLIP
ncbi:DUF943 family protein [Nissabacter archeti]|uniref:DUF943 family protein n=1 Tax=Nissabacter archeti TaxID=1917880 RepID=A0ABS5JHW9_9GAMM|nr:DUF943 family protein [Nissabacter archeti]